MMDKQLINLVESGSDVVPYIKTLKLKERKLLLETNLHLYEKYFTNNQNIGSQTWNDHIDIRKSILLIAISYMGKKQFKNLYFRSNLDFIREVLDWYQPRWIEGYIREYYYYFHYNTLLALNKKEKVTISNETFARSLLHSTDDNLHSTITSNEVTLKIHLWEILKHDYELRPQWQETIIQLFEEKKLNKSKVFELLLESMYGELSPASIKSKISLCKKYNPGIADIIKCQPTLLGLLYSEKAQIRNLVFGLLKRIAKERKFLEDDFLDRAVSVVQSQLVSDIKSTLQILKELIKKKKSNKQLILELALCGFNLRNSGTQELAKIIILDHSASDNLDLSKKIIDYHEILLGSNRDELFSFFGIEYDNISVDQQKSDKQIEHLTNNKIFSRINSLEDFIRYLNDVERGDQYPDIPYIYSCIGALIDILKDKDAEQIEAFISGLPYLSGLCINPIRLLKYILYRDYNLVEPPQQHQYRHKQHNIFWPCSSKYQFEMFDDISRYAYKLITNTGKTELLSSPTHHPCFIDPSVFVNRIIEMENNNIKLNSFDFQMAIQRLPSSSLESLSFDHINNIKNNEIKQVINYTLNKSNIDMSNIINPELWISSLLYHKDYKLITSLEKSFNTSLKLETCKFDWTYGMTDRIHQRRGNMKNPVGNYLPEQFFKKEYHIDFKGYLDLQGQPYLGYSDTIDGESTWHTTILSYDEIAIHNYFSFYRFPLQCFHIMDSPEISGLLSIIPNHPGLFLTYLISVSLQKSDKLGKYDNIAIVTALQYLKLIWQRKNYDENCYLFISCCFLLSNTTIRKLTSQLWIEANHNELFDNAILSQHLCKLYSHEYASISRFATETMKNLLNISEFHNQKLTEIYEYIILNSAIENKSEKNKLFKTYKEIQTLQRKEMSIYVVNRIKN